MTAERRKMMREETIEKYTNAVLSVIDKEREREIIARRYGLFERKETLEQIGELLGITRERVRQLEKSVIAKLKEMAEKDEISAVTTAQDTLLEKITENGNVMRTLDLATALTGEKKPNRLIVSRVAFLADMSPKLALMGDNDNFHQTVTVVKVSPVKYVEDNVAKIISTIKEFGKPHPVDKIAKAVGHADEKHTAALSSTSKHLATLNGHWGLIKWPTVNPKNIRDKIYVILKEKGSHMHFNEIAQAIKGSEFKRKDVTTQAIHNELIKDGRFVLIGRGLYALKEWGYARGTVSDIIADILKKAGKPLHRDEIVKEVLKNRYVKETTILLNLQSKPQFKRVAKATYTLAE
ncbi:MAG: sigma factor-like helix-turn-helix DNA-binding protein [Patescibacteria group bacterium]